MWCTHRVKHDTRDQTSRRPEQQFKAKRLLLITMSDNSINSMEKVDEGGGVVFHFLVINTLYFKIVWCILLACWVSFSPKHFSDCAYSVFYTHPLMLQDSGTSQRSLPSIAMDSLGVQTSLWYLENKNSILEYCFLCFWRAGGSLRSVPWTVVKGRRMRREVCCLTASGSSFILCALQVTT